MKGGVRERSKGKYSYYFKYKDEYGKWKTKEKGGFTSKKEAQSALRKAITEFEEEGFVECAMNYSLEEYIEYYFTHVAEPKLKYTTLSNYRNTASVHIYSELGHLKLNKITTQILQNYFTKKSKKHHWSVIQRIKVVLKSTLDLAVKQKILKSNPLLSVEFSNKADKPKRTFLNLNELDTILQALTGTRYYFAFLIGIHTGMRRGEILALTWDDIDFERNLIKINKQLIYKKGGSIEITSLKTENSVREILMPTLLAKELLAEKERQDQTANYYGNNYYKGLNFVCCSTDGYPIIPQTITTRTVSLSKKLGIPFRFHDLRHSHASLLLEADVNLKVIQDRLGHAEIRTTLNIYSHVSNNLEIDSIEKFNQLISATKK